MGCRRNPERAQGPSFNLPEPETSPGYQRRDERHWNRQKGRVPTSYPQRRTRQIPILIRPQTSRCVRGITRHRRQLCSRPLALTRRRDSDCSGLCLSRHLRRSTSELISRFHLRPPPSCSFSTANPPRPSIYGPQGGTSTAKRAWLLQEGKSVTRTTTKPSGVTHSALETAFSGSSRANCWQYSTP